MAKFKQKQIIEVNFKLPDGFKPHPVIILSNQEAIEHNEVLSEKQ